MDNRDDFSEKVKKAMAYRVGCRCSNPKCRKITYGPKESVEGYINIGVAAHICAAAPGGKRYDSHMSKEARSSIENGIWLCQSCSKLIDSDDEKYTVEILHKWKKDAETITHEELTQEKDKCPFARISLKDVQKKLGEENIYGNKRHLLRKMFVSYSASGIIGEEKFYYEDVIKALLEITELYSEKFFLMLGDYGVGKSSTLKMLASVYNNGRFLYISLKDVLIFSNNIMEGIYDYCSRAYQLSFNFSELSSELILLLDGFDELQRYHSDKEEDLRLFMQIYKLTEYPFVKVILSSRGTAFLYSQKLLNYSSVYLNDFNDGQIKEWICKWKDVNSSIEIKISLDGLIERNLLEICRNKLILYMVARIYNDELLESRQYTKAYIYKSFYDWTIAGKFIEDSEYKSSNYQSAGKYDDKAYRHILQDIALVITQYASNELVEFQILKEQIQAFQREEIVQELFEINKHLFTRHFFSAKYENQKFFIEFAHKSLREYLYAEKLFEFIKKVAYENNIDIGEWIQFGRNKRLSSESFDFLKELLMEMPVDILVKVDNEMYNLSLVLLIANGRYKKFVTENNVMQGKAIMNITESFYRSLILSVIAGIINSICYDLVLEIAPEKEESIRQISCDKVYKICDYYMDKRTRYIDMYPLFLQFVKYINIHDEEITYINYINMEVKRLQIHNSVIQSGVIQEVQSELTDVCNVHFISTQINDIIFKNGTIKTCSFMYCNLKNITFSNVHFCNVRFDILINAGIKFEACTFSETIVENYIHNGHVEQLKLENKEPIDIIL